MKANKVSAAVLAVYLALFFLLCTLRWLAPADWSLSERRPLAQLPEHISPQSVLETGEGSLIGQIEDFVTDQFPLREGFRALKAHFAIHLLRLPENNGLVLAKGHIARLEGAFSRDHIAYSTGRLRYVYEKYLADTAGARLLCIVPDKNYILGRDYGYPMPDYASLERQVAAALPEFTPVAVSDLLTLDDYYRTDTHWRQERITDIAARLRKALAAPPLHPSDYRMHTADDFRGVYYLQSALYPAPDTLHWLQSEVLDGCTVYDAETGKRGVIYDFEQLHTPDPYAFFLSGTRALLRIDNPAGEDGRELVIFRDSFGSSLAPLLVDGYARVWLVDIRYLHPDVLGEKVDFSHCDVLLLYSSTVLSGRSFK